MDTYVTQLPEFKHRTGGRAAIVMFTAGWCGPCKRIKPDFDRLAEMNRSVDFFKVDVDKAEDIAVRENIKGMPTFKFYLNGVVVKQFSGADVALLEENVKYLLSCLAISS